MFLKDIELTNFRNYSELNLELGQSTLLLGNNAQGKSNLLESIYFLATTKSLRAEKDVQLIREGEGACIVSGEVEGGEGLTHLEIGMQVIDGEFNKRVKVNGVPRRVVDYIGNLVVVPFAPEDINLVTGAPSLRRWHIDLTLAQIDRDYKKTVTEYSEVITARNRVLKRIKEGLSKLDELDFWTNSAVTLGETILQKRTDLFGFLNQAERSLGDFAFDYQPNIISESRLQSYQNREIAAAMTLIGPHRDDFTFKLNGQNLAFFGSRGEQRTAVLDLKLTELEYTAQAIGSRPLLLLDDVFSELDAAHRQHVVSITGKQQTVVTAVETDQIPGKFLNPAKRVRVEKGRVHLCNKFAVNLR